LKHIGWKLSDTILILLGAGNSTRFGLDVKKQWLYSGDIPLWLQVAQRFEALGLFDDIIIVSSSKEIAYMKNFADYRFVEGGNTRQESLKNALKYVNSQYVMVSDIARCCVPDSMIQRIYDARINSNCVVPTLKATDTLYMNNLPIDRESVAIIQTPQLSQTTLLKEALKSDKTFTDDSSAIASLGYDITFVEGDKKAHKLTTIDDLHKLECIKPPINRVLVGYGIDTHPFEDNKPMYLCGIKIDSDFGFKAHSDGDVAIHALIDALLGASGMGDIGELYPDSDDSFRGIDSTKLLTDTVNRIKSFGFEIVNVDMTIVAQTPRLKEYKQDMRQNIASILGIRRQLVNIKATTAEKLGFIGRKEGVSVHAVANLKYFNHKEVQ
jgi:2-C-methyl-D-erythritol 4-phosphate cytidylyltransferase/2-C-methyl-D-erythritol 2,4-cyclodiphosphate synthase